MLPLATTTADSDAVEQRPYDTTLEDANFVQAYTTNKNIMQELKKLAIELEHFTTTHATQTGWRTIRSEFSGIA